MVIENIGGIGGITGLTPYYHQDLARALHHLLLIASSSEHEIIFVPTNQKKFCYFLVEVLTEIGSIDRDKILCVTATTHPDVIQNLIQDCKKYVEEGGYQIVIASPVFGTGFSIDKDLVTTTFGFMFQYPPNVSDMTVCTDM